MDMEMSKEDAAYELAWFSASINCCGAHWAYFKGTGEVAPAVARWSRHQDEYPGVFSSAAEAELHIKKATAETLDERCPGCELEAHNKTVGQ